MSLKSLLNLKITYVLFLSHFWPSNPKNNVPERFAIFEVKNCLPEKGSFLVLFLDLGPSPTSAPRSKIRQTLSKMDSILSPFFEGRSNSPNLIRNWPKLWLISRFESYPEFDHPLKKCHRALFDQIFDQIWSKMTKHDQNWSDLTPKLHVVSALDRVQGCR